MSKQLQAYKKGNIPNKNLYYPLPKTLYESFINKKWVKRKDIIQSRSAFIKTAHRAWKESNESERQKFLKATPPQLPTKSCISFYFKKETTSSTSSATTTANAIHEKVETEKNLTLNEKALTPTVNTSLAIGNREEFLSAKEIEMIRNIFISFDLPFESFFMLDVRKDKNSVQLLTAFCYK